MFASGFDAPFGQPMIETKKPLFVSGFDAPFGQPLVAIQTRMYAKGFDAPFGQPRREAQEWSPPTVSLFDRDVLFGDKELFTLDD